MFIKFAIILYFSVWSARRMSARRGFLLTREPNKIPSRSGRGTIYEFKALPDTVSNLMR